MFNYFSKFFIVFFVFIIICFIGLVLSLQSIEGLDFSENEILTELEISSSGFIWPTPNYKTITSPYGYRIAPTNGAGTFHGGIDIGAPTGTNIYSVFSGEVTYIGFKGPNGYTIQISNGEYLATYSHISPYFLVYLGQQVKQGDIIASVGPKNVYDVPNNPYKDSSGNPTNGATTGPHLHFSLRINNQSVNPIDYIN